ncbi:Retrovirus-related Pol polyprotein from transposon 17.6, partial [Fagus crenata]
MEIEAPITWKKFVESFYEHYFTKTFRAKQAKLFVNLQQGSLSVVEYKAKFTELSRFAPHMVDTKEHKVDKVLDGLNFNIRERLIAANITEYKTLVHTAEWVERDVHELGHFMGDCPVGGGSSSTACYRCGKHGHFMVDCPVVGKSDQPELCFEGKRKVKPLQIVSSIQAKRMLRRGVVGYLAYVINTEASEVKLEDIPV